MSYKDVNYSVTHSIQRFEERYHKKLTISEYNDIVKLVRCSISSNNNITSKKRVTKHNIQYVVNIKYNGFNITATYETERDTITTFLPFRYI